MTQGSKNSAYTTQTVVNMAINGGGCRRLQHTGLPTNNKTLENGFANLFSIFVLAFYAPVSLLLLLPYVKGKKLKYIFKM